MNCGRTISFLWPFPNIPTDLSHRYDRFLQSAVRHCSFNRHQSADFEGQSQIAETLAAAMQLDEP